MVAETPADDKSWSVSAPARLKALEQKAGDRDLLATRCKELEQELAQARASLSNATDETALVLTREKGSRLGDLERKAAAYDTMIESLNRRDKTITQLTNELAKVHADNASMSASINGLNIQILTLTNSLVSLQLSEKELRNTVEQLLMGNFEYYEVRAGDTVESIASQPTIYGDASRQEWIRQANWKRVEDIDQLRVHQMLIIPRFPPNGRYEF